MYTFEDRDGTSLTLRPEGTASVVRAYVEHALHAQRAGVEALLPRPDVPPRAAAEGAPAAVLADRRRAARPRRCRRRRRGAPAAPRSARRRSASPAPRCELNSLGDRDLPARPTATRCWPGAGAPRRALRGLQRAGSSTIRCACSTASSPAAVAHPRHARRAWSITCCDAVPRALRRACVALLARRRRRVRACNPYMVRGLDYYCRTAFEVVARGSRRAERASAAAAATTVWCSDLGGPDVAGVGFALGVERLILSMADAGAGGRAARPKSFVAPLGAAAETRGVRAGAPLAPRRRARRGRASGGRSLKSQMRHADKLGARYVLILGEDELASARADGARHGGEARLSRAPSSCRRSGGELRDALAQLAARDRWSDARDARSDSATGSAAPTAATLRAADIGRDGHRHGLGARAARPRRRRLRRPARPQRHRAGRLQPRAQRRRRTQRAGELRSEYVIAVRGTVARAPGRDGQSRTSPPARSR